MLANDKTIRAVHIFSTMGQSHGHINGTPLAYPERSFVEVTSVKALLQALCFRQEAKFTSCLAYTQPGHRKYDAESTLH